MYFLGHIGVSIFTLFIFQKIIDSDLSKFYIYFGLGSMLPDMIDKPIGSIFFGTGRWFGHSIFFLTSLFIIFIVLIEDQKFRELKIKDISKVIYIGSLLHLLEDGTSITSNIILWPFNGSISNGSQEDFLHGFEDTFTVFFEIFGLLLLLIIGISDKWGPNQWKLLTLIVISYLFIFFITYLLIVGL